MPRFVYKGMPVRLYNNAALEGGMALYNDAALEGGMFYNDAAVQGGAIYSPSYYNSAAVNGGAQFGGSAPKGKLLYNSAAILGGWTIEPHVTRVGFSPDAEGIKTIGRNILRKLKPTDEKHFREIVNSCFTQREREKMKASYLTGLIYLMDCYAVLQLAKNIHKDRKLIYAQKYHWLKNQLKSDKRTLVQSGRLFQFFHHPKKTTVATGRTARNDLYKALTSRGAYGPNRLNGVIPTPPKTHRIGGAKYKLGSDSSLDPNLQRYMKNLTTSRQTRGKRVLSPAQKAALVKRLQDGKRRKQALALALANKSGGGKIMHDRLKPYYQDGMWRYPNLTRGLNLNGGADYEIKRVIERPSTLANMPDEGLMFKYMKQAEEMED